MKNILARLGLLSALVVSMTSVASANMSYSEGTWAVAARAGIAPATFSRDVSLTSTFREVGVGSVADSAIPAGTGDLNVVDKVGNASIFRKTVSKSFGKLYSLPFTAGADVGYFVCDNWEVFLNFDYSHACSKKVSFTETLDGNPGTVTWKTRDLNSYGFYLGSRNYFCPMDCVLPFVGAKLGIKSNGSCNGGESYSVLVSTNPFRQDNFTRTSRKNCAAFSGGLQLGLDWMFADCYALTFMSEMVGTSGRHFKSGKQDHVVNDKAYQLRTEITRNPRGVLEFPLTLGIRVRM